MSKKIMNAIMLDSMLDVLTSDGAVTIGELVEHIDEYENLKDATLGAFVEHYKAQNHEPRVKAPIMGGPGLGGPGLGAPGLGGPGLGGPGLGGPGLVNMRTAKTAKIAAHVELPTQSVDVRTQEGRDAYDRAVNNVVSDAATPIAVADVTTNAGGTTLQARTALNRLINRGLITYTGKARGTRYSRA